MSKRPKIFRRLLIVAPLILSDSSGSSKSTGVASALPLAILRLPFLLLSAILRLIRGDFERVLLVGSDMVTSSAKGGSGGGGGRGMREGETDHQP